ncbi:MAG: hypothetical protein AABY10_04335, partial [Nanoarchaeota archaeon]
YKENFSLIWMNKRGQTSIFIIVAIVIFVAVLLVYFFYPNIKNVVSGEFSPSNEIENCLQSDLKENIVTLSNQGGYLDPEGFILYQNDKVKYLCYTSQYYLPCKVQQALIKKHFEDELNSVLKTKAETCISNLVAEFKRRGYEVSASSKVDTKVEIVPQRMEFTIMAPMSVTKENTQTYDEFKFNIPSEMYNILMISTSIIDFESTYGNSETNLYTQNYPNIKIDKAELDEGSTVYTVNEVTTKEKFRFASRSLAWPGGYGRETQ